MSAVPESGRGRRDGRSSSSPETTRALAAALSRLLADPARAAALGRAGLERARTDFSVARMTDATLAVYDEACAPHEIDDLLCSARMPSRVAAVPASARPALLSRAPRRRSETHRRCSTSAAASTSPIRKFTPSDCLTPSESRFTNLRSRRVERAGIHDEYRLAGRRARLADDVRADARSTSCSPSTSLST